MIWIAAIAVALWVGFRVGLRAGSALADDHWIEHLGKHGWRLELDEDDPEGPGAPTKMYGDHWYDQRGEEP
jgi:hypothetical protein